MVYNAAAATTFALTPEDVTKQDPITLHSPTNPTPIQTIFLSNIDQTLTFPVETLFFFKLPPNNPSTTTLGVAETVKMAVEKVLLVPYYFMAGRLRLNHDNERLELVCNNGGVVFVNAESRVGVKELGDLSQPNPSFHHLIHRPGLYKPLADTPIFTIQVTRFKCGGFSLGFMTNHAILDGKSASEMFKTLASICNGQTLKTHVIDNDRTPLRARTPPQIKHPHKEYYYTNHPKTSSLPSSFTPQGQTSPSPLVFTKKCIHKLFCFDPETIVLLKKSAKVENCSSFEAILGHIWRARTKALFGDLDDSSTVFFAVDIREKIWPPLGDGFAGNAVITGFASARVKDLVEKPLGFSVEKVREGKERVSNDDYVRSVIDWLEVYKGIPATCNGNFYVSAWWKLPFNELDFGYGKPIHGGPVVSGNDEFVLLLSNGNESGKGKGGINVWIGLERDKMERFSKYVFEINW